eukprot:jgi/Mesen1/6110/ME000310S05199
MSLAELLHNECAGVLMWNITNVRMPALGVSSNAAEPHGSSSPLSPAEEKKKIDELSKAEADHVKEGDTFYVISARWWRLWARYVGQEDSYLSSLIDPLPEAAEAKLRGLVPPARPGVVNNKDILAEGGTLKELLQEDKDYILLYESCWKAFIKWYGGGPPVARKVIKVGLRNELSVEVYPLQLTVERAAAPPSNVTIIISKKATVDQLKAQACTAFKLKKDSNVRLRDNYANQDGREGEGPLLEFPDQFLEEAGIQMGQSILLEEKVGGVWPRAGSGGVATAAAATNGHAATGEGAAAATATTTTRTTGNELAIVPVSTPLSIAGGPAAGGSSGGTTASKGGGGFSNWTPLFTPQDSRESDSWFSAGGIAMSGKGGPLGLTGLANLGNTCFMNSALQCLVHTQPLVDFFTADYTAQINKGNPLGMEGELAVAFGELLRKLWAPGKGPISPRAFKTKLAKFAPQFSGYNQHDSQLLAFLLDGLHEDLNRVHKKPYIEAKDADDRPDEDVASEFWSYHKARNDSIIVDTCQGQYKSTLVCPECSKVSVTFDPFMYLSLQLPSKSTKQVSITILTHDGSAPPAFETFTVPKTARFADLQVAIRKACNLASDKKVVIGEIYQNRIYKIFGVHEAINVGDTDKLVAYVVPVRDHKLVAVVNRKSDDSSSSTSAYSFKPPSSPLLIALPEGGVKAAAQVYDLVLQALRPFSREQAQTEAQAQAQVDELAHKGAKRPAQEMRSNANGGAHDEFVGAEPAGATGMEEDTDGAAAAATAPNGPATVTATAIALAIATATGTARLAGANSPTPRDGAAGDEEEHQATPLPSAATAAAAPAGNDAVSEATTTQAVGGEGEAVQSEDADRSAMDTEPTQQGPLDAHGANADGAGGHMEEDCQGQGQGQVPQAEAGSGSPLPIDEDGPVHAGDASDSTTPAGTPQYPFALRLCKHSTLGDPIASNQPLPAEYEAWSASAPSTSASASSSAAMMSYDWKPPMLVAEWVPEVLAARYDLESVQVENLPEVNRPPPPPPGSKRPSDAVSLYTCLESFLKEEPLGPDDMWYCPKCKEHRQASKKLDLWRLPDVLVVHLKRFSYNRYVKTKLDTMVHFPVHDLDLTDHVLRKDGRAHVYELFAVSNHFGGLGGGHYTAYAKLHTDNTWYNFDDSHVSPSSESEVMTTAAYVLFYKRKGRPVSENNDNNDEDSEPTSPMDQDGAATEAAAAPFSNGSS